MSVLTTITHIPLFDNLEQALSWGARFGLEGHHEHAFNGQIGYMAGETHSAAMTAFNKSLNKSINVIPTPQTPTPQPTVQPEIELDIEPVQQPTVTTTTTTTTTTGGGGGGGY